MCKIKHVVLVAIMWVSAIASAQVEDDFGIWISGSYDHSVTKGIDFKIKQEFRLDENASRLKKSYSTFRLDFNLNEWMRFQANYRFILNQKTNGLFGHRHRLMADLVLYPISRRFTLSNRIRFQSEVRTVHYSDKYGFAPANSLRNTVKINYRINRIYRPFADFDFRFLLRDPRTPYYTGFDRHRIKIGVEMTLARKRALDFYFMHSLHHNIKEPKQLFVVGMNFSFGGIGRIVE